MRALEILRELGLVIGTAKKRDVLRVYRATDDEWIIQAADAAALFPGDSEKHNCMSITTALIALGCDWNISNWRKTNRAV